MKLLPILFFFFFPFSVKTEKTACKESCKECCNKTVKTVKNVTPAVVTPPTTVEPEVTPSSCEVFFFKI